MTSTIDRQAPEAVRRVRRPDPGAVRERCIDQGHPFAHRGDVRSGGIAGPDLDGDVT